LGTTGVKGEGGVNLLKTNLREVSRQKEKILKGGVLTGGWVKGGETRGQP